MNYLSKIIVSVLLSASCITGHAAPLLEKVKKSGEIILGVREASGVLSYQIKPSVYSGYHVELCLQIVKAIEKNLGQKVKVKYFEVSSANRLEMLDSETIDLECGSTTNNLARQKQVDFANTTFIDQVGVVVLASSPIQQIGDLLGKKVAVTQGATSASALVKYLKSNKITLFLGEDHPDGMASLTTKVVDAFVLDRSLLAGLVARSANPAIFRILPDGVSIEPIAIAMRKKDPEMLKLANSKISELSASGELVKLYQKWFLQATPPNNINLNLAMSEQLKQLLQSPNNLPAEKYPQATK